MSESYTPSNPESAEQEYLIDARSGYFKALQFASSPVAYFSAYREELNRDGFADSDICGQAMAEMAELENIICNEEIAVSDVRVQGILAAEYDSEAWVRQTFGILKEAGFTRDQAMAWVILDDDELTDEERKKERTQRYFIHTVYDEV